MKRDTKTTQLKTITSSSSCFFHYDNKYVTCFVTKRLLDCFDQMDRGLSATHQTHRQWSVSWGMSLARENGKYVTAEIWSVKTFFAMYFQTGFLSYVLTMFSTSQIPCKRAKSPCESLPQLLPQSTCNCVLCCVAFSRSWWFWARPCHSTWMDVMLVNPFVGLMLQEMSS